jgi:feoA domain
VGLVPGAYVVVLASEAGGIVVSLEDGQMVHIEDTQASGIIVRG